MATISLFPTNSVGASWSKDYDTSTGEGGKNCKVTDNTIKFRGDGSGSSQGYIYSNYLAKVNLSNYSSITISISDGYVWALGHISLVVQSSSGATASATKSVKLIDETKIYYKSTSINVSNLSGNYYVGLYCKLNSYSPETHDPTGEITCSIGLVEASYTVTLNKGTGISAVSPAVSNTVTPGSSITIDATVSDGYTWKNWTGSATLTNKQNTITPSGNVSYTANATANTYTLTFNANGGTTPTASKSVTYNSTYGTLPTPTRTGYTFNGWYTAASGGTQKTSSSTYSTIGNSTLYAHWTAITYTIAFNANGGSGTMSNMSCSYNTEYTLTVNSFTRTNYMFMGWATSANGEVVYKDKASIKNLSNTATTITLYAVWQQQGTVRIMVNNEYKTAQAYIFKDGFWLLTQPWTYSSGWKINGG